MIHYGLQSPLMRLGSSRGYGVVLLVLVSFSRPGYGQYGPDNISVSIDMHNADRAISNLATAIGDTLFSRKIDEISGYRFIARGRVRENAMGPLFSSFSAYLARKDIQIVRGSRQSLVVFVEDVAGSSPLGVSLRFRPRLSNVRDVGQLELETRISSPTLVAHALGLTSWSREKSSDASEVFRGDDATAAKILVGSRWAAGDRSPFVVEVLDENGEANGSSKQVTPVVERSRNVVRIRNGTTSLTCRIRNLRNVPLVCMVVANSRVSLEKEPLSEPAWLLVPRMSFASVRLVISEGQENLLSDDIPVTFGVAQIWDLPSEQPADEVDVLKYQSWRGPDIQGRSLMVASKYSSNELPQWRLGESYRCGRLLASIAFDIVEN